MTLLILLHELPVVMWTVIILLLVILFLSVLFLIVKLMKEVSGKDSVQVDVIPSVKKAVSLLSNSSVITSLMLGAAILFVIVILVLALSSSE